MSEGDTVGVQYPWRELAIEMTVTADQWRSFYSAPTILYEGDPVHLWPRHDTPDQYTAAQQRDMRLRHRHLEGQ